MIPSAVVLKNGHMPYRLLSSPEENNVAWKFNIIGESIMFVFQEFVIVLSLSDRSIDQRITRFPAEFAVPGAG